jgi:hypothetical protein
MTELAKTLKINRSSSFRRDRANEDLYLAKKEPYEPPAPPKRGDRRTINGDREVHTGFRWELESGFARRGEKLPGDPA